MEPSALWLLSLLAGGLALKAASVFGLRLRRRRLARELDANLRWTFRTAAERAGLSEIREAEPGGAPPGLEGRAGRFGIELRQVRPDDRTAAQVLVKGLGHGSPGLTVRRQPGRRRTLSRLEVGQLQLGDAELEQGLQLSGDTRLALALLDRQTGSKLAELVRGTILVEGKKPLAVEASLSESTLTVELGARRSPPREELAEQIFFALRAALDLAPLLVAPEDLAAKLAQRLRREGRAGVRLRILAVLKSDFHDHPATGRAFAAARADRSREVRALVAEVLGPEDPETLRRLVERRSTPSTLAAEAVKVLGKALPAEVALATLRRALARRQRALAKACFKRLKGSPELGQQELLLAVLDFLPSGKEALFVARELGRVGTAAAVPALRALERRGSARLVEAARQSITEIQASLPGAEYGQVSLAGSQAGALSLAEDDEPGRLSLVREDVGKGEPERT